MIKKLFHILFAIIFSLLFSATMVVAFYFFFLHTYHINIIEPKTYRFFAQYWNGGGVLKTNDLLMLFILVLFVPLNIFAWIKIYHCKFANLVIKPVTWLFNHNFEKYKAPDINIKNLKVEEKKSLEQFISERVEKEKKKTPPRDAAQFRRDIIEKIENKKNS